jgi:hypothetical protein
VGSFSRRVVSAGESGGSGLSSFVASSRPSGL